MTRLARAGLFTALAAIAAVGACSDYRTLTPKSTALTTPSGQLLASVRGPDVRISEFHYDNPGTDVNETIEISGPAGTDLTGWSIVLYNGNPSARIPYNTTSLSGVIPATCGDRGVVTVSPPGGLQNGHATSSTSNLDPDGIALMNGATVVDVIAYEGTFVALGGPAVDRTFPNIGVRERGTSPEAGSDPVWSLKRSYTNTWSAPSLNNFGTCNDNTPPAPQVVASVTVTPGVAAAKVGETQLFTPTAFDASSVVVDNATFSWVSSDPLTASVDANGLVTPFRAGDVTITATTPNSVAGTATLHVYDAGVRDVWFSEIHYDNPTNNEGIEVETPANMDLSGWYIQFYDGDNGKMYLRTDITGTASQCSTSPSRGVINFSLAELIQNGPDAVALIRPADVDHPYERVVEFISYEGTFTAADGPAQGKRSVDIGKAELGATGPGNSLQRKVDGSTWYGPAAQTFGECNVDPVGPPNNPITFTGRGPTDPSLPVGHEDQLFATERDEVTNAVIPTTFMWTTETPNIATIDGNGVILAWAVGTATIRATAADGATATWSLSIVDPPLSPTAVWSGNLEFGQPIGPNDRVVTHAQFTASFDQTRRIANWVSAKLEASHFGDAADLCDCFTYDATLGLPMNVRYTTANYPSPSGVAAAFERGFLLRSTDLTASDGDNKFAYLFTNVVPMSHDLRVGAWAGLESYLGGLARAGQDVYMVAGSSGSSGTVRNEGKVTIPSSLWKVALIMPHGQGLADVHSAADVQVVAALMPNVAGANPDWTAYRLTVDALEAAVGFDVFSLLEDQIEIEVESGSRRAVARLDGPYTSTEGSSVAMSAAASSDPDGDALTSYDWNFGDGATATGVSQSHTYTQQGSYTVTLTVTESHGLISSTTTTATVSNVAPAISAFSGATISLGDSYSASGTFTDPGADTWTATVNYGDGATQPLALSAKSFSLSHVYTTYGDFTVSVSISDGSETSTRTQHVLVRARPHAALNGPFSSTEGAAVSMNAGASSDADGTIQSVVWNFGDGSTGSGPVAAHAYPQEGSYTVTVTVMDNDGLTDVVSSTVTVSNVAPQIASFAGGTQFRGETYSVSGSFTDPGDDTWSATVNYGDGSGVSALSLSGKAFSLSHTYSTLGSFTVTVTVSDGTVTSTRSTTVLVRARPVAAVNGPFSINEGTTVTLDAAGSMDPDGTIQTYSWNFGDGTTGSGAKPSHAYMQDGSFTVTLTVVDNDGLSASATTTVSVANVAPVVAAFEGGNRFTGDTYSVAGSFTDPGSDNWTATVNYGDGTSGPLSLSGRSFTLSHVYTVPGTFTIQVSVSDGVATATKSAVVTVRARPIAAISGVVETTEGGTLSLNGVSSRDLDGTIVSYSWSFGDGTSATGQNVSHTYPQDGAFVVTLTVTDNDGFVGVASATARIANVAPAISSFAGAAILQGETYRASGFFTDPGADVWQATVNYTDGGVTPLALIGKTFALTHTFARSGHYTVTVRVSDDDVTSMRTATVSVMSIAEALQYLLDQATTDQMVKKIEQAIKQWDKGNKTAAMTHLRQLLGELDGAVAVGVMSFSEASPLKDLLTRVIAAMGPAKAPAAAPTPAPTAPNSPRGTPAGRPGRVFTPRR